MLELRSLPSDCAQRRRSTVCAGCGARAFSVCGGLPAEDLERLDAIAERVTLRAGTSLARQGDPVSHVFNITSGCARVFKLLPDGRRQIIGFLFTGDFVGVLAGKDYAYSVEAIEDTGLCRFQKSDYDAIVRQTPALERALLDRVGHELAAAQNQILMLGRKSAQEKIASFLLDLPGRDPSRPAGDGRVRLPMTRSEIADYLGLTIETVSRVLTKLKTAGVIRLVSLHELVVEKPDQLRAMAGGEA